MKKKVKGIENKKVAEQGTKKNTDVKAAKKKPAKVKKAY